MTACHGTGARCCNLVGSLAGDVGQVVRGLLMLTTALILARCWLACAPHFRRARSSSLPACCVYLCAGGVSRRGRQGERVLVGLSTPGWSSRLAEWWAECAALRWRLGGTAGGVAS
eukprot:9213078-Alexandrium_andersonii.AAC.1